MIKPIVVALLAALALSVAPRNAEAGGGQAWCAYFSYGLNDCGYVTLQQCRAALSGVGGTCNYNPFYSGYPPPRRKYVRWRWW